MKIQDAKGVRGFLIWNAAGGYFFRVYDKEDKAKFQDYDIFHCDLEITIEDGDAFLYQSEDLDNRPSFLDYGPLNLKID